MSNSELCSSESDESETLESTSPVDSDSPPPLARPVVPLLQRSGAGSRNLPVLTRSCPPSPVHSGNVERGASVLDKVQKLAQLHAVNIKDLSELSRTKSRPHVRRNGWVLWKKATRIAFLVLQPGTLRVYRQRRGTPASSDIHVLSLMPSAAMVGNSGSGTEGGAATAVSSSDAAPTVAAVSPREVGQEDEARLCAALKLTHSLVLDTNTVAQPFTGKAGGPKEYGIRLYGPGVSSGGVEFWVADRDAQTAWTVSIGLSNTAIGVPSGKAVQRRRAGTSGSVTLNQSADSLSLSSCGDEASLRPSRLRRRRFRTVVASRSGIRSSEPSIGVNLTHGKHKRSNSDGAPEADGGSKGSASNRSSSRRSSRRKAKKVAVFGSTLEDIMKYQGHVYPNLRVPCLLNFLTEEVNRLGGFRVKGIFRLSVPKSKLEILTKEMTKSKKYGNYELNTKDPNVPAALLKHWLRQLPVALFPNYDQCLHAADSEADPDLYRAALLGLPSCHREVALYLAEFLIDIARPEYAEVTKMAPQNVATVMAPSFLRSDSTDTAQLLANQPKEEVFVYNLLQLCSDPTFVASVRDDVPCRLEQ